MNAASMFEPSFLAPAIWESFRRLSPQAQWRNPVMFVLLHRRHPHDRPLRTGPVRAGRSARRLHPRGFGLALDHGAVREFRRSHRRGPRQGAGRRAARLAPGHHREKARRAAAPCHPLAGESDAAGEGRRGPGRGGRQHPARRRGDRRRRLGQRIGDHRRIRAGDPRIGRRFLLGHRRHGGAVRLAAGTHHRPPGRIVPRPHDRAGRGRQAPEDAQ